MGLGGTGTAHIEGPTASFWNPANLMIRSGPGSFHISIGNSALSLSPLLPDQSVRNSLSNFADSYLSYKKGSAAISDRQQKLILQNFYGDRKLLAHHRQNASIMIAGALWQQPNHALSIAIRGRYGSNNTVGRGWYDKEFLPQKGQLIRDFSLTQRRMELYELALGYAQELTFINGLLPGLNKLYIGITPKFIVAASHFSADYKAQYRKDKNDDASVSYISKFDLTGSGRNSRAVADYRISGKAHQAINNHLSDGYQFKPTGYGLGFDFGLNYVIPLSSQHSRFDSPHRTGQSLRIAFSINDIGAIRFHDDFLKLSAPKDSTHISYQAPINRNFGGAEGQFISFLDQASSLPNPLLTANEKATTSQAVLLPSSINAGILLDLASFKLTGDLTLGLNDTAFTSNTVDVRLGMEVRPVRQIPIRLGTVFAKETPPRIAFGTGLETKYWDFTVSGQTLVQQGFSKTVFSGAAFGGLQLHF